MNILPAQAWPGVQVHAEGAGAGVGLAGVGLAGVGRAGVGCRGGGVGPFGCGVGAAGVGGGVGCMGVGAVGDWPSKVTSLTVLELNELKRLKH